MNYDLIDYISVFLEKITPLYLIKFFLSSGIFIYIFFAIALWRQTTLMTRVVEAGKITLLKILSLFHLFAAIALFLFALIVL